MAIHPGELPAAVLKFNSPQTCNSQLLTCMKVSTRLQVPCPLAFYFASHVIPQVVLLKYEYVGVMQCTTLCRMRQDS